MTNEYCTNSTPHQAGFRTNIRFTKTYCKLSIMERNDFVFLNRLFPEYT